MHDSSLDSNAHSYIHSIFREIIVSTGATSHVRGREGLLPVDTIFSRLIRASGFIVQYCHTYISAFIIVPWIKKKFLNQSYQNMDNLTYQPTTQKA